MIINFLTFKKRIHKYRFDLCSDRTILAFENGAILVNNWFCANKKIEKVSN